jgi:predicted enzyme related to lactoylglutathione lyase
MAQHGTIVWNELNTWEPEKAMAFYGKTLGWVFDEMQMGERQVYRVAKLGDQLVGGIFTMTSPQFDGMPSHWFAYVEVDDVDQRCAAAVAAGATILHQPFDIPTVGRIAIVKDPTGAVLGWMTSAPQG